MENAGCTIKMRYATNILTKHIKGKQRIYLVTEGIAVN